MDLLCWFSMVDIYWSKSANQFGLTTDDWPSHENFFSLSVDRIDGISPVVLAFYLSTVYCYLTLTVWATQFLENRFSSSPPCRFSCQFLLFSFLVVIFQYPFSWNIQEVGFLFPVRCYFCYELTHRTTVHWVDGLLIELNAFLWVSDDCHR